MELPNAEEAYLKTSAYVNASQRKRHEDAYELDMKNCLAHCAEQVQAAIPEGRFSAWIQYSFSGPNWAGFKKDLSERLAALGYRAKGDGEYHGNGIGLWVHWGPTFWEKLWGRKAQPKLALPLLPPADLR
jgi:hypothetical protein